MSMTLFPAAMHHRLHSLARQAPDAPALTCCAPHAVRLTRGELDLRAARLAALLRARGVGVETRVGVCIERSCDLFVAMLAVLKAGGVLVPLDPRLPEERIEWMARDAGASICIVSPRAGGPAGVAGVASIVDVGLALGTVPETGASSLPLARDEAHLPTHPHAAAYLIYTSGSTGTPKGVVVEHGPLAAHCDAVIAAYPMRATDRVLHFASIGFDLAHEYWLAPLAAGASIVITEPGPVAPHSVHALMARERVTVAAFPPAYLHAFAEVCEREGVPPDVRVLAFGGEAMRAERFERLRTTFSGIRLINGYGPTETVISPMLWPVDPHERIEVSGTSALPIGRAIGPRSARVTARDARDGVGGELLLGGACLARGYRGRAALTAQRFIPDEHGPAGARVYRTGDLARLREDGAFDYLGRLDDQVQLRGMRVEPGEIEQALQLHPSVREAVVLAETSAGDVRLIAFVAASMAIAPSRLREHMARRMPEAWIPARTIVLDALPRTLSGKVDRQGLLALAASQFGATAYRAPAEPIACSLAQIWHAIVGGPPIGLDDRFVLRGGDSIGVMQLQSAIDDRWAVRLPLSALFEDRSLEELASLVHSSARTAPARTALAGPAGRPDSAADDGGPYADYPVSFAQRRFWALARIGGVRDAYHIAAHWNIEGRIDPSALSLALSNVIDRHGAWRTALVEDESGTLVQRVHRHVDVPIDGIDLRGVDPTAQALQARELAEQWAGRPFDLSCAPLLRAALVTFADDRYRLMLTLHHAIGDGWSSRIAFDELARAYNAICEGTQLEWPVLPMQYADYACKQRQWLDGGARTRQLEYWRRALADAPAPLALPLDRPVPPERTLMGERASRKLDAQASRAVRALARETHGSPFMVLLSALHAWLHRLTGATDLVVAVPVTTRRQGELASLIGLFVNTVALRARVAPSAAFSALLAQVRETTLGAYEHCDVPFDEVIDAIDVPVRRGGDWLRVKFAQQFVFDQPAALADAVARLTPGPDLAARFDFAIDFTDDPHGIELVAAWATDCIDAATARGWLDSFAALVEHAVREPSSEISSLACHGERGVAVLSGPPRVFGFPHVLDAFAHQAAEAPQSIAVSDDVRALTFAELDAASSAVANALTQRGVGNECAVALGIERSVDFVIGLLGVMKAGAIAVPLDPSAPCARTSQALTACAARWLIVAEAVPSWAALSVNTARLEALVADGSRPTAKDAAGRAVSHVDQAAYVIFTSGSTGTPKGVLVSHRALADYVQGMLESLAFAPDASMAMVSTVAADLGHTTLFGALCSGRTLHLLPSACAFDPDRFAQVMRERGVGILKIVPSHVRALLEAQDAADVLPSHALVLGGEPLPYALARRVGVLRPACRVINHYGPTEATVGALALDLDLELDFPPDDSAAQPPRTFVSTGRPLPNVRACVLDAAGSPVPPGAYGELYLGGPKLARGYVGQPAATAERFVPDPYGPPGARRYRTGDRVRARADGIVEWAGRLDDQVKIRGHRVEPGEVSAALASIETAAQVETLAVRDERGARLVAFVVLAATARNRERNGAELRARLAERLPDYMVPGEIVICEALPMTANGKVDRARLRERAETAVDRSEPADEIPLDGTEGLLQQVWRAVLRVDRVGRDENFFALGGDSILALQVIARARKLGVRFTPKQLFDCPTLARLAEVAVREQTEPSASGNAVAGVARLQDRALSLTPAQHRFFALGARNPHHWNQAVELEPLGVFDLDAFAQALGAVLSHHDVFRLRFMLAPANAGKGRAFYAERAFDALPLAVADVRDDADALAQLNARQREIDLTHGPLVRALAAQLPDGRTRVFLAIHHLIVDGVSWRIVLEDLQTAYEAVRIQAPVRLPTPSASTATAPTWAQRLAEAAPSFMGTLPFWLALRNADASLPRGTLESRSTAQGIAEPSGATNATARTLVRALDPRLTATLLTDANVAWRTQTHDLLLAALVHALTEDGALGPCLVELEGHGREAMFDDIEASRTLGWLTSHYPMALPVGSTLTDTLVQVKDAMRAVPNRGLAFGVLRYLGDEATRARLSSLPKPRIAFNYLGRFEPLRGDAFRAHFGGVGCERDPAGPMATALAVHAFIDEARTLYVHWVYGSEIVAADAVERIARRFEAGLAALAADCRERVAARGGGATPSDFPLAQRAGLTQASLDAAGIDWRQVDDVYPLSPMQQGILFESLLAPEQATYVNQFVATLDLPDIERLSGAFERTLREHDVLRTSFFVETNPPLQGVHRRATLPIAIVDWRDAPTADFEQWLAADRARGFSLSAPPLMRLTLIRLNERAWRLVWTRHHLLLDGWSTARLFADVLRDYAAGSRPPTYRAGPRTRYRDFIAWLAERDEAGDRAFWLDRLARLDGPTLIAEPSASAAAEPAQWRATFDAAASAALAACARRLHVTVNTIVQGAWALALHRMTNQRAVAFGATVAGRPDAIAGIDTAVGLFINTLPVIATPSPTHRISRWLTALQNENAACAEHAHTPLFEIQRWAGRSGAALFDTLIVFENYPIDEAWSAHDEHALRFSDARSIDATNFAVTLVVQAGEQLTIDYGFDRARVADARLHALHRAFARCVEAFVADSSTCLGSVSIETVDGLEQAARCNATARAWGTRQSLPLHRQFERQAAATPDATALLWREPAAGVGSPLRRITYAELNARANGVAASLFTMGVMRDAPIALCLERSIEMVVALLGVMKAGAAWLPIDPDYPQQRIAYMLADARPACVVTQRALLERVAAAATGDADVAVTCIESLESQKPHERRASSGGMVAAQIEPPAQIDVAPGQLAYLIYTSGSTGQPKGAGNTHGALANRIAWMQEEFELAGGDVVLQKTPFGFDVSVWEFLWPLSVGATLALAAPGDHREPARLVEAIEAYGVTTLHFVPSMLAAFVGYVESFDEGARCASVVRIIASGEALPRQVIGKTAARMPQAALHNLYGPTEAAIDVSHWRCEVGEDYGPAGVPIGRPIANIQLHVLDAAWQPLPVGAVGELYLGGIGLARGYHRRPSLTAERFIPDPFVSGARLYRTGDLVARRADGALDYLGRVDLQVKLRGLRIEPGEIEALLRAEPSVDDAVVIVRAGQLWAYVARGAHAPLDRERVYARLRAQLPAFMVPARLIELGTLPLTPNGKCDRAALPLPGPASDGESNAPALASDTARELASIWAQVLRVEHVGRDDDFFSLGGHSLSAAAVHAQVNRRWGLALPLRSLFAARTLARYAATIEDTLNAQALGRPGEAAQTIGALLDELEAT